VLRRALRLEDFGDAGLAGEKVLHLGNGHGVSVADEHVRELVIRQRPGAALLKVDQFAAVYLLHIQQASLAEQAIGIQDVIDRRDDVLARHQPQRLRLAIRGGEAVNEPAKFTIEISQRLHRLGTVRAELLRSVVEMLHVEIEEVGTELLRRLNRRRYDPLGRLNAGERSPVVHQRKMAELREKVAV